MVNLLWFPSWEGLGVGGVSEILTRRLINISVVKYSYLDGVGTVEMY